MLYCPKCQQTYEDAVQRFCSNDGGRLLPAPSSGKSVHQTGGVFTSILNRKAEAEPDKFAAAPGFSKTETRPFAPSNFQPSVSKTFKAEPIPEPAIESPKSVTETVAPIISPVERPTITIEPIKDKNDLKDRELFTGENPQVLIGQFIKGRYRIVEQIGGDEDNYTFLAADKIVLDKRVVVRVLSDEDASDAFGSKMFDEEKVALSHVNHPNIANVIDSGVLPEGNPFVVTEFVEGKSVKDYLRKTGQFNALRTARIVQQAANALDEVHQSGVLHRNLKPENIILSLNEKGKEEVKLTGFGTLRGGLNEENLPYKSPEQVAGKLANFSSDGYALAVIAYQMLTNRLPFKAASVGSLLKAQREGVTLRATDVRSDLPPSVDEILRKALAFNSSERYPRVRGFGDAFYNAVAGDAALNAKETEEIADTNGTPIPAPSSLLVSDAEKIAPKNGDVQNLPPISGKLDTERHNVKRTKDSVREIQSTETPNEVGNGSRFFAVLGVTILLLGLWGIWTYFIKRPSGTAQTNSQKSTEIGNVFDQTTGNSLPPNANVNSPEEIESPPLPRSIVQPPNTYYFQNKKEFLDGEAMKNFLGFSLYYPIDWKINATENKNDDGKTKSKFLDVSKNAASGTPIEQMIVSYYDSRGTFKADAEIFAEQVKETNETLKKIVPNYEMVSEGEKLINNGWRAYEVKFQGTGKTANGETITLWGKRLFVPTAMRGLKNGYVITMLATSLSGEITSVDEVGVKGELAGILQTFEPNQNF